VATYATIVRSNLFLHIRLPTKQVFTVASKTGENCKLFDKCIFDNIPQLGIN